jgi:hypothetical protein
MWVFSESGETNSLWILHESWLFLIGCLRLPEEPIFDKVLGMRETDHLHWSSIIYWVLGFIAAGQSAFLHKSTHLQSRQRIVKESLQYYRLVLQIIKLIQENNQSWLKLLGCKIQGVKPSETLEVGILRSSLNLWSSLCCWFAAGWQVWTKPATAR